MRGHGAILLLALALVAPAGGARAQAPEPAAPPAPAPWGRFEVPDTLLRAAVFESRTDYEAIWNALLVAELRSVSGSKNALVTEQSAHLLTLARGVAKAEADTLGSHIGDEALVNFFRWIPSERDQRVAAAVAESSAVAAQGARQLERAERQFRGALTLYRQLGERRREAWVVGSLGGVSYARGDLPRADSLYREALLLRRRLGDPRLVGNTLNALGITNQQLRRFGAAYVFLLQACAVREGLDDGAALSNTLNLLGLTAVQLDQPDSARIWYDRALAVAVAGGDSARAAEVLLNHGLLLGALGEHAAADGLIGRAAAIARQRADPRLLAQVERSSADVRQRQGRLTEALQGFERAVEQGRPLNDALQSAQDLLMAGQVALTLRDPVRARPSLERALAIADSLRSPTLQARALTGLCALAALEGDLKSLERLGARALGRAVAAGDSQLVHEAAAVAGQRLAERGEFRAARFWAERALVAGRMLPEVSRAADLELGARIAAHIGRPEDAARGFRFALELSNHAAAPDLAWRPTLGLADLAAQRGDAHQALDYGRQAATLVESLHDGPEAEAPTLTDLARERGAFEALVHWLGTYEPRFPDSAYLAESFEWAERARARALSDLARASALRRGVAAPPARPGRPPSLKDARAWLDSDREALLEYCVGDSSTSLWVVTRRRARHLLLAPRPVLVPRIAAFRRGLGDPTAAERGATISASRALYRALIEPALADLVGVSHLIVVADDALALIPFEALLTKDVAAENALPEPGSYLIERVAISYAPSAATLAALRPPAKAGAVLALGDPTPAGTAAGADPAPYHAAAEIAALKAAAGSRRVVTLTGSEATRARLLALPELRDAGLVHLAAPGVADERDPGRSGLWLSPDAGGSAPADQAGVLALDDLAGLALRAELVALPACESGLGPLEHGEGVEELARAFMAAGARGVLASLWRPDDRTAARFWEAFYGAALQRGDPREEALAAAKRALLARPETRSPYYWAPYVMVGGGGRLK